MDADSLAFVCGILGLDVPEQKKVHLKLYLKYILRKFNSEDVEGNDDGDSSCYAKIHKHLRASFSKNFIHLLVSNKNLNALVTVCLTVTSFPRIPLGEIRQLFWWLLLKSITKDILVHFEKYDVLFSIMVLCLYGGIV